MKNINKPTVLITGAASGIGKATAEMYIEQGFTVYALDINEIEAIDGMRSFKCDITNSDSLNDVAERMQECSVTLDASVCVAGIHAMTSFVEGDVEKMKKLIDINLLGTIRTVRAFHRLRRSCS